MSHSNSNDDDWWVQKQVEMQSHNQNQKGEKDMIPVIAGNEEQQQHLVRPHQRKLRYSALMEDQEETPEPLLGLGRSFLNRNQSGLEV
jgi:hypothetical protein